ncbi:MAG: 23S rRNA (adenine(2503)-C(2))-methyltransferase RlmN [Gammaproteobacteria bacterium]|nr:MAG: 23S rRNA (adenine(2503)-C(2))-methyltransferase RlmN [Gammaproteobacteria bacterium]
MKLTQQKTTVQNLMGMPCQDLEQYFSVIREKPFRATQVMKWTHQQGITDYEHMTNLSKSLRDWLSENAQMQLPEMLSEEVSTDGTRKWLLRVDNKNAVETVYIPEDDRATLCVSSQVGCVLDCTFCATARQGFAGNLSSAQIIAQLWFAEHRLRKQLNKTRVISNVVFMGMGEPLANFDNVVKAIQIMMDDNAYGLGKRKVTVSTSGLVPKIDKLREALDVSLAVSLHAPNDEVRNQLVPLNRRYPISELISACHRFLEDKHRKHSITFEYVMLDQVNDQPEHAKQLVKVIQALPSKVNLIPFNSFPNSGYQRSSDKAIEKFRDILQAAGITTITRRPRGEDIAAACGQLAGDIQDQAKRKRHYEKLYEADLLKHKVEVACA